MEVLAFSTTLQVHFVAHGLIDHYTSLGYPLELLVSMSCHLKPSVQYEKCVLVSHSQGTLIE